MKKTNCGIYKIINLIPNKITGICKVYIGSSENLKSRKYMHFWDFKNNKHDNMYLQRAVNKYGIDNFKFENIKYIEKNEDKKELKEELLKWEQYYLNEYVLDNEIDINRCYNLLPVAGSSLGYKHSSESKTKMSTNRLGKTYEEIYGSKKSEEIRSKKSISSLKENNPFYNKKHTEKTKQKMRKPKSEESKCNMRKNNTLKRKIINLSTEEIFDSITSASDKYGIHISSISKVCRGDRKSAGGYEWRYYYG